MKTPITTHNPANVALVSREARLPVGASSEGVVAEWMLGMTLSGAAIYTVAGQQLECRAGRVTLVRPRSQHHWRVLPPDARNGVPGTWHVVYSAFRPRPHWHEWFGYDEVLPGFRNVTPADPGVRRLVAHGLLTTDRIANGTHPLRIELAMNALERVLLLCWSARRPVGPPMDARVAAALDHLRSHLSTPVTLVGLADACHCSRAHMAHLFQRQMGVPPMQFHESIRIDRAMELLRTTIDPIKSIAHSVGFEDPKYFSKRFRRLAGVTPAIYRVNVRGQRPGGRGR